MTDFKPFDIITAPYNSLTGNIKKDYKGSLEPGLFLVIAKNEEDNTLTCCKITSNNLKGNPANNYYLALSSHPFLQTDSWVQCDKLNTIFCNRSVKVGSLIDFCRRGFISKFTLVFGQFRIALEKYAPDYISPNKIK